MAEVWDQLIPAEPAEFANLKISLCNILDRVEGIAERGKIDSSQTNIVRSLKNKINMPFNFTIIGKVNAGKSSFVNALLGNSEICKVAATICTTKILEIFYSENEKTDNIDDKYDRVGKPIEILRSISIIDTPGTDSVQPHHDYITSNFIPMTDLVFFVFLCINPYTESDWQLIQQINGKGKKIVFILQQADRANPGELETHITTVRAEAISRLQLAPDAIHIFCTSARCALAGQEGAGITEVREFIHGFLKRENPAVEKIQNIIRSTNSLLDNEIIPVFGKNICSLQKVIDIKQRIDTLIGAIEQRTAPLVEHYVNEAVKSYEKIGNEAIKDLEEQLGFFLTIKNIAPKGLNQWFNAWWSPWNAQLCASIVPIIQGAGHAILNTFDDIVKLILGELKKVEVDDRNLEVARASIEAIINRPVTSTYNAVTGSSAPMIVFTSGMFGVIGGITSIIIPIDIISGGIITLVSGLIALGTITYKRRKFIREFRKLIKNEIDKFKQNLKGKIKTSVNEGCVQIKSITDSAFTICQDQLSTLKELQNQVKCIKSELTKVSNNPALH